MNWLAGGEVVAGVVAIVVWWLALRLVSGRDDQRLTNTRFVVLPAIFLLWIVGGIVLVLRGLGVLS